MLTYAEVQKLEGAMGDFRARVVKHPRYVKEDICNACGDCLEKCPPRRIPDEFEVSLKNRHAIYLYFSQGIPAVMTIDPEHCLRLTRDRCGNCEEACEKGAIDFDQQEEVVELEVGAVIMATGLDVFDPSGLTQYGYGRLPNVITGLEYERLINATGPTEGHLLRPSDGEPAKRVAYVQCVGSRDVNNCDYCSSVCCMYSIKDAMLAREHDPESTSYVFHTDLRNVGKWFQNYQIRGAEEYGIRFVRGRVAEISEDEDHNTVLWYEDTITREVSSLTADMAVLATAAMPSRDAKGLAGILGIQVDKYGFVTTGLPFPTDTSVPGIYACGFCKGPADIPESVAQASAAAARASQVVFPQAKAGD